MKRITSIVLAMSIATVGFAGCAEKSTSKVESKTTTPGGTTTTTVQKTVEKTGSNPPPSN